MSYVTIQVMVQRTDTDLAGCSAAILDWCIQLRTLIG